MKKESLLLVKNFITIQLNFWALFTPVVTFLGMTNQERPALWLWSLCSLLPFFFFLCRRYTHAFWIFAVSHLLGAAVFIFLPGKSLTEKILLLVYVAVLLGLSVYLRLGTRDRLDRILHPGIAVGIMGIALWVQNYSGRQDWDMYYIVIVIGYLGFFFLEHYIDRYLYFLYANDTSNGNIPEQAILHYGLRAAILYSIAGVLILLATANIGWLAAILQQIKRALLWLLRLLLRNLPEAEEVPEEKGQRSMENMQDMVMEPAEKAVFWEILEKIFMAAFFVAAAVLLLWLLRKLIHFLIERFNRKTTAQTVILKNGTDVHEKCQIEKQRKAERKSMFAFLKPRERIRKIFRKQVLAGKKQLIGEQSEECLGYLTARECGEGLQQQILTEVYEKARYSSEECTLEDIRRLKKYNTIAKVSIAVLTNHF